MEIPDGDILIAVIGVTGAGKSTFISKATGREDIGIGHGIESCTESIQTVSFTLDNKRVVLLDTPGFDDTYTSDVTILQNIAGHLQTTYQQGRLLHGLIFLQPININRLQGSETKRTRLFREIMGEEAYSRCIIATTMWDELDPASGDIRVKARLESDQAWKGMIEGGAEHVRHDNTHESAIAIISKLVHFKEAMPLLIQTEFEANGGTLAKTGAGRVLNKEVDDKIHKLNIELEETKKEKQDLYNERLELSRQITKLKQDKAVLQESPPPPPQHGPCVIL